jgi:hypothetical protein
MNGLMLRARALGRRAHLDAELAAGADPSRDPTLELRASQLTGAASRAAIASTIHHLLDAAEEPPEAWGAHGPRPPLQREAILAARADLIAIAERLAGSAPVTPRSAALAAQLVWDAGSPIYADTGLSLSDCTRAVLTGLPLARAA